MFTASDTSYMERALALARQAAGRTSPNPLVGCVIVRDGAVVGEGFHAKAGTPHAEALALAQAGELARGADVYVTLEPCNHYGRTPPCTDALLRAGVRRVVAAMVDPNPQVGGQGLRRLRAEGIQAISGLLQEQARQLNQAYIKAITSGLPFVLYKAAFSLDGKTSSFSPSARWISSPASRQAVHALRNVYDVVMVGSRTVAVDNPLLTCRLPDGRGRNPVRLVVDGQLLNSPEAQVFQAAATAGGTTIDTASTLTLLATTTKAWNRLSAPERARWTSLPHVEVWPYPSEDHVPLPDLMRDLARRGWNSVLLEGGETLAAAMLEAKLIDKIDFFYAPKLYAAHYNQPGHPDPVTLTQIECSWETGDLRLSACPNYPPE